MPVVPAVVGAVVGTYVDAVFVVVVIVRLALAPVGVRQLGPGRHPRPVTLACHVVRSGPDVPTAPTSWLQTTLTENL